MIFSTIQIFPIFLKKKSNILIPLAEAMSGSHIIWGIKGSNTPPKDRRKYIYIFIANDMSALPYTKLSPIHAYRMLDFSDQTDRQTEVQKKARQTY